MTEQLLLEPSRHTPSDSRGHSQWNFIGLLSFTSLPVHDLCSQEYSGIDYVCFGQYLITMHYNYVFILGIVRNRERI